MFHGEHDLLQMYNLGVGSVLLKHLREKLQRGHRVSGQDLRALRHVLLKYTSV